MQLLELRKELKKHQDQAQDMTQKSTEWSTQLQSKLNDLRDQKKAWMTEATDLRSVNVDLKVLYSQCIYSERRHLSRSKAHLTAQGSLLADAQNKVFQLETEIKTDAHKVQRLRDYETRIEQLTTMHRMWYVHNFLGSN